MSSGQKRTLLWQGVCVKHLHRCKTSILRSGLHVIFITIAGGHSISLGLCPTKLPVKWDIQLGQLDVPAIFHRDGKGLSQVPQHYQFFEFTRSPQSEQPCGVYLTCSPIHRRLVVTTSPISSPTTAILVILFYSL